MTTLATTFTTTSSSYVDVTGLSVTFTAEAGRRYLVELYASFQHSSANATQTTINNGTSDLAEGYTIPVANGLTTITMYAVTTPAAGSVTLKARTQANGGATTTYYGISTRTSLASRLLVTDIGLA
jgi:hypothetical protein